MTTTPATTPVAPAATTPAAPAATTPAAPAATTPATPVTPAPAPLRIQPPRRAPAAAAPEAPAAAPGSAAVDRAAAAAARDAPAARAPRKYVDIRVVPAALGDVLVASRSAAASGWPARHPASPRPGRPESSAGSAAPPPPATLSANPEGTIRAARALTEAAAGHGEAPGQLDRPGDPDPAPDRDRHSRQAGGRDEITIGPAISDDPLSRQTDPEGLRQLPGAGAQISYPARVHPPPAPPSLRSPRSARAPGSGRQRRPPPAR